MREFTFGILGSLASVLAASCCIVPTLFVVFGVSTGSLSFLKTLEPYRIYFLLIAYIAVGYSFYKLYLKNFIKEKILKKPTIECACDEPNWIQRVSKGITWTALILLLIATFYPYVLEKVYGG